ncbi:NAD(P)/FAD-dependent oxidoreductase [Rhodococcus sp. P1Y]|uniref:NAD(P)/FAD-dependent oxidoreductase n=1 Tax=Rhodococcus sp. P1Y TaxID=1302308 RepID=UPI000EB04200|nr:FAD-dependent oxidoreductase [Rhodococcus sp. P1Y]AYJ50345.1 ferredoxin reductase [Rhodococcus sp. P1Y]
MTTAPGHILVIGAGLGGIRTIEALRQQGFTGRLSLVGSETHLPYDRPPLSKQVLSGQWEPEKTRLVNDEALAGLAVDTYLGRPVIQLDGDAVRLSDGASITADIFVIATGSKARRLPGQPEAMTTLRTLDDAITLRSRLTEASSALIVGAGFIGTEIASAAVGHGVSVTMIEAMAVPFARTLGTEVGQLSARLIRENGVDLQCGVALREFVDADSGVALTLEDGSQHRADIGVVGIGGTADVEWLVKTPLIVDNGIRCDSTGRAYGADNVWALGDAAAWLDPVADRHVRCEHWNSTISQARSVAASILGVTPDAQPVPYFWSDQFGLKIQAFGHTAGTDTVEQLHGDGLSGGPVKGTVLGHFADNRLIAVTAFGAPRHAMKYRQHIENGSTRSDTVEVAAGV